ncbi:MAG: hypothetical protein FWG02_10415 [Holophagaceae bacterium]|nr:hypothetical protein [Holophagaceae bacterium]
MPHTHQDPKITAKNVAWVDRSSYLAHTIRILEYSVSKVRRKPFVIIVRKNLGNSKTRADFNDRKNYCDIFLADTVEYMDNKKFRLVLAHELGHLFYNFDNLNKTGFSFDSEDAPLEEELYAWIFAYWLIFEKSEMFKSRGGDKDSIFEGDELKQALLTLIRESGVVDADYICKHVANQ